MSRQEKQELIAGIKKVLREHEEPYELGAWEMFQQQSRKKNAGILFWKTSLGAAASLLLVVYLTFLLREGTSPQPTAVEISSLNTEELIDSLQKINHELLPPPSAAINAMVQQEEKIFEEILNEERIQKPDQEKEAGGVEKGRTGLWNDPALLAKTKTPFPQPFIEMNISVKKRHLAAGKWREADDHLLMVHHNKNKKKAFSLGFAYAPGWNTQDANQSLNMSGGVLTDWNFNRNMSLGSGIVLAQNQLAYNLNEGINKPLVSNAQTSVQVDLLSLEIPLNLRYYLSDKFSFSAGISSAAFLKENYHYEQVFEREVQVLTFSDNNDYETVSYTVTVTEVEQHSQPSFNTVALAAFYTFSVGYRYDLSEKYRLGVEPFIKLPTGMINSEDLKFTSGGMQLKISF